MTRTGERLFAGRPRHAREIPTGRAAAVIRGVARIYGHAGTLTNIQFVFRDENNFFFT